MDLRGGSRRHGGDIQLTREDVTARHHQGGAPRLARGVTTNGGERQYMDNASSRPLTVKAALAQAKSLTYRDGADAPATRRAYDSDMRAFEAWCAQHQLIALPATPEVVGAYLAAAGEGYAISTLHRRVAAIAHASAIAGHPLNTRAPAISETLRGIGRLHGSHRRRAAALGVSELKALTSVCEATMAGDRDRALLLIGFAGALRRSELVGLDIEHLTRRRDGVALQLPPSKNDPPGEGGEVLIVYGRHSATCPMQALELWLEAAAITAGPVFRRVRAGGQVGPHRLSADAVRDILLKRAHQAGLESTMAETISPHGLRAGFVTTAYDAGVPDEMIMGQTRHRDIAAVRKYIRRARISGCAVSGKLGL